MSQLQQLNAMLTERSQQPVGMFTPAPQSKPTKEYNYDRFMRGIVQPENSGKFDWSAKNPTSTATGAFQILYSLHKDELLSDYAIKSRDEFAGSKEAQIGIMKHRIDKYRKDASDLRVEYAPQLKDKFNFTDDEIMALVHFVGRQGTRKYFAALRDGKDPSTLIPGRNITHEEYLKRFNQGLSKYK